MRSAKVIATAFDNHFQSVFTSNCVLDDDIRLYCPARDVDMFRLFTISHISFKSVLGEGALALLFDSVTKMLLDVLQDFKNTPKK